VIPSSSALTRAKFTHFTLWTKKCRLTGSPDPVVPSRSPRAG
jgi:hypothetical protein